MPSLPKDLRASALCRGEGVGYIVLSCGKAGARLAAHAELKSGRRVQCELFHVGDEATRNVLAPKAQDAWVVVVPLLACDCTVCVFGDDGQDLRVVFPALRSKVSSRLLTRTNPVLASTLRGFERRRGHGRVRVDIDEVFAGEGNDVVWRVKTIFPTTGQHAEPSCKALDAIGEPIAARVVTLEDQVVPDSYDSSQRVRLVTFSCSMPQDVTHFHLVATLGKTYHGFAGMNPSRAQGMIEHARNLALGYEGNVGYDLWFDERRATELDIARHSQPTPDDAPLMSVLVLASPDCREGCVKTIESVLAQSMRPHEVLILNIDNALHGIDVALKEVIGASGSVLQVESLADVGKIVRDEKVVHGAYACFVRAGDVLELDAIWRYAKAIAEQPGVGLLYCDEDRVTDAGNVVPVFKVGPNFGKLYSHNYVGNMLMVSRTVLRATTPATDDASLCWAYDLVLKAFELECEISHIPCVLYHRKSEPENTHEAGRVALAAHLGRRNIAAQVDDGPVPCTYRVRYQLPADDPKVSIVVPTRDHAEMLTTCVVSILERSTYKNLEIVLVENNSEQDETYECYDNLRARDERVRVVRWKPAVPGTFNYSAIVNHGARQATGDYLVLLNNDTEVIEPSWIEEMLGCLMRPEVGVVGAKLLFEDGLTQHVFVSANPNGDFMHVCQNLTRDALGPGYAAAMPGDCSMVTGACQMMRRSLFERLGGYDEQLAVGFNDGDFCLRVAEEDYVVTVAPYAILRHREFSTRGREATDSSLRVRYVAEKAYVMGRHPEFFGEGDPAINPNLDKFSPYLSL